MAINTAADIRCGNRWRHRDTDPPQAVAMVNDPRDPGDVYRPRCDACIEALTSRDDVYEAYDVAYLDPARQRRPPSDPAADQHPSDLDRSAVLDPPAGERANHDRPV
jgi:hypothetical protein